MICRPHHVAEVGHEFDQWLHSFSSVQIERRNTPQGDLGQDPECSNSDAGHAQQVGFVLLVGAQHRSVANDNLQTNDGRGEIAEADSSAVCSSRSSTGDRLPIDVAEVRQGKSAGE